MSNSIFDQVTFMVAAEAGGAEILSAIAKRSKSKLRYSLSGVAIKIFEEKLGPILNEKIEAVKTLDPEKDFILSSSGYISKHELQAMQLAKETNIYCVCYLDHWMNYTVRFGMDLDWRERLPNEIWVCDQEARKFAISEGFPDEILKIVPNPHFEDIRHKISILEKAKLPKEEPITNILFLSEPLSQDAQDRYGNELEYGFNELSVATELVDNLSTLKDNIYKLRIRIHPAEPKDKYNSIIDRKERENINLEISGTADYMVDIAWADIVVGIETIALYYASLANKKVFSIVLTDKYYCHLPHKSIIRVKRIEDVIEAVKGDWN